MTKKFVPIAVRDDCAGNTVVSYDVEDEAFLVAISGKLLGPITLAEIKSLRDNLNDVIEMGGRYLFIKEYDTNGRKA